ncbi:MAG: hypothetical protein IKN73_02360 [Alphaproteobacteria bacterium]|nr:hypothetical protein [Alphaproteobacteria bacterium]
MKRIGLFLCAIFISVICHADTINLHWLNYDGSSYQDSTCTVNGDLNIPTTPPTKYGYTFTGWKLTNYIPIEYIQGDKQAYIDTGVVLNNNSSIEARFQFPNVEGATTGNFICGSRASYDSKAFVLVGFSGGSAWASNYNNSPELFGVSDTLIHVMKREKEKVYFDGINVITSVNKTFTTPGTCFIFSANQNGQPYLTSNIKLWYVKIWDNDIIVRDMIPVLDGNGVPCMFDKVEAKFYYNQGTGQFIAGPVLQ